MAGEGEWDGEEAGVTSEAAALMAGMRNIGLCALPRAVDDLSAATYVSTYSCFSRCLDEA
jgi:hypothetical protein